jgi:hypothetical protein
MAARLSGQRQLRGGGCRPVLLQLLPQVLALIEQEAPHFL